MYFPTIMRNVLIIFASEHATHIETKLKQHFGADTHVGIHLEPIKVNGKYQKPE